MLTDIRALADHFLIAIPNINKFLISNHVIASLSLVYALIDFTHVFTFAVLLSKNINNDTQITFPGEMLQWSILSFRLRVE